MPDEVLFRVNRLRVTLLSAGAAAVVVCEVKPMHMIDVTPYNSLIHNYLKAQGGNGYGCETQIRLDFLKNDGFHVRPQFDPVIDRTYACAVLGIPVPNPTPRNGFTPAHIRRQWESEWPEVGGRGGSRVMGGFEGPNRNHGWGW